MQGIFKVFVNSYKAGTYSNRRRFASGHTIYIYKKTIGGIVLLSETARSPIVPY